MQDENANTFYEWPDDFFSISNAELNLYAGLEKRAIIEARNSLCQRGIIEVNAGQRRAKVPQYKLQYLSIRYNIVPKNTPKAPQNDPKNTPKAPQNDPKNTPITPQNHPLIYKLKQTKETYSDDEEEKEYAVVLRTREDGDVLERAQIDILRGFRDQTEKLFLTYVGRKPMPAETDAIYPVAKGIDIGVVDEAIRVAASHGGKNIAMYARKLLVKWKEMGIKDFRTLEEVLAIEEMVKTGYYSEANAREKIQELTGK